MHGSAVQLTKHMHALELKTSAKCCRHWLVATCELITDVVLVLDV